MSKTLFPKGARVLTKDGPGTVCHVSRGWRDVLLDTNGWWGTDKFPYTPAMLKNIGDDKCIIVSVRGGCVQDVEGVPPGWTYEVLDYDNIEDREG